MLWFEKLTGFREESPEQVRASITLEGSKLKSLVNGKVLTWGELETPSLAELRERVLSVEGGYKGGQMLVREVVDDVQLLHCDKSNAGALFQTAQTAFSQVNLTIPFHLANRNESVSPPAWTTDRNLYLKHPGYRLLGSSGE